MSQILFGTLAGPVLDLDADERLSMVIIGLFVLAGIIAVLSVLYWWATRPGRVRPGDPT